MENEGTTEITPREGYLRQLLLFALIPLIMTPTRPRAETPLAQKEWSVRFHFVFDLLGQDISTLKNY
jgi:hypothetical protein